MEERFHRKVWNRVVTRLGVMKSFRMGCFTMSNPSTIRDPSGVLHEVEIVEKEEDMGVDLMFTDGWYDTSIGCDECKGLLFYNAKMYKCNECGEEYPIL